jgi:hypothetical protein
MTLAGRRPASADDKRAQDLLRHCPLS